MGYFASRSAPMGRVGPGTVAATFYVFNPELVAHFLPAAWDVAEPTDVVAARYRGCLRAGGGCSVTTLLASDAVAEAAELARRAAAGCTTAGRPLSAAHADLPWPEAPHLVLFHALTVIREHRGDGHIAALLTADLSGVEALVSTPPPVAASPGPPPRRPAAGPTSSGPTPRLPGRPRAPGRRRLPHRRRPSSCAGTWRPHQRPSASPPGTRSATAGRHGWPSSGGRWSPAPWPRVRSRPASSPEVGPQPSSTSRTAARAASGSGAATAAAAAALQVSIDAPCRAGRRPGAPRPRPSTTT